MLESPLVLTLLVATAAATAVVFVAELGRALPSDSGAREGGLPAIWRICWPALLAVGRMIRPLLSAPMRLGLQRRLARAGLDRVIAPHHLVSAALLGLLVSAMFAGIVVLVQMPIPAWALAAVAVFALVWPAGWLREVTRGRRESLLRSLPFLIDLLAMAVESGLPLAAALTQAVERLPAGPLRDECRRLVRDVKAGMPRDEALRALSARLDMAAVTQFVTAVSAAQRDGGAIVRALRAQAEQQRNERFQLAEHRAAQAPVRVLFPLVVFIFPGTLAIVLFPVVNRMLAEVARWQ